MRNLYFYFITILYWLFFLSSCIILMPTAILIWFFTLPFDKNKKILHQFSCFWGWILFWINPVWKLKIKGKEKINRNKTYVIISNHQSLLDILVIYSLFIHFKWVAKIELFSVPIVGWLMKLNNYVSINRGNKNSAIKMIDDCLAYLTKNNSIMIFPEGTRSEDGTMRKFKEGAFRLALQAKAPILPIVLNGTSTAIPKNSLIIKKAQKVNLHILDEIPYERFKNNTPAEIAQQAKTIMETELQKMQRIE